MNLLNTNTPEPVYIEISKATEKYGSRVFKKVFCIAFLRQDTCQVLRGLFESIDKRTTDAETAKQTNYVLVEENRELLCLIIAIAICNHRADFSKRILRFISDNTSGSDLLALTYVVQRQLALFIASNYLYLVHKERIEILLQQEAEKNLRHLHEAVAKNDAQTSERIQELQKISKDFEDSVLYGLDSETNDQSTKIRITGTKKLKSNLTITCGTSN